MSNWIVENLSAPHAIGDCISSFPALHSLAWENPIKVYLAAEKCRDLFWHPKAELLTTRPIESRILDIQQIYGQYSRSGLSMPRAYLMAAGFQALAKSNYVPEIHFNIDNKDLPERWDYLLAPFSASDLGTGTKVWPEENWLALVKELKKSKKRIGILGTEKDDPGQLKDFCELVFDRSLIEVCKLLRGSCGMLISVDNGLNWLAQGVGTNHILLIPKTHHPNWTANPARNAINMLIDATVPQVISGISQLARLKGL